MCSFFSIDYFWIQIIQLIHSPWANKNRSNKRLAQISRYISRTFSAVVIVFFFYSRSITRSLVRYFGRMTCVCMFFLLQTILYEFFFIIACILHSILTKFVSIGLFFRSFANVYKYMYFGTIYILLLLLWSRRWWWFFFLQRFTQYITCSHTARYEIRSALVMVRYISCKVKNEGDGIWSTPNPNAEPKKKNYTNNNNRRGDLNDYTLH